MSFKREREFDFRYDDIIKSCDDTLCYMVVFKVIESKDSPSNML